MKSDWMSSKAINSEESWSLISLQKENESLTVYSLTVNSLRIDKKNFARLYMALPIANRIGRKGRVSFVDELYLWTLHKPNLMPGLVPTGFKNL